MVWISKQTPHSKRKQNARLSKQSYDPQLLKSYQNSAVICLEKLQPASSIKSDSVLYFYVHRVWMWEWINIIFYCQENDFF